MSEDMSKMSLGREHSKNKLSRGLLRIDLTQPKRRPVGPCEHHRHHQQPQEQHTFELGLRCVFAFWLWCPFCIDAYLQTEDFYAQTPLHKAAFMRRYACTQRFAHGEKCCAEMPLSAEVFVQRYFHTDNLLHTDAFHKDAFARINRGT